MKHLSSLHIVFIIVVMGLLVFSFREPQPNPKPVVPLYTPKPITPQPQPKPPEPEPEPEPPPKPQPVLNFDNIPVYRIRIQENSKYADIINRAINPVLGYDRDTDAHESTHMIQSTIRNEKNRNSDKRYNSFYLLGGKGISFPEPKIKKRDIAPYVPSILRESRYNTYVTGQSAWDNEPLYLVDEWCAYMNGAEVSLEEYKSGRHDGTMYDAVKGPLEFSVYCTALCMAIKDKDPEYWEREEGFKYFMKEQLKRSYHIVMSGLEIREFQGYRQNEYISNLKNSDSAELMRQFLIDEFDGVWVVE